MAALARQGLFLSLAIAGRRDGLFTMIECREHGDPQDVMWIEELIGRRASLHADAVIAVSASGFTSTALRKAAAHGIATRELQELTPEEIAAWGRAMQLKLYFVRFADVDLEVGWVGDDNVLPTPAELQVGLAGVTNTLFNPAGTLLQQGRTLTETVTLGAVRFGYKVEFPEGLAVGSGRSEWISVKGKVWLEVLETARPVVKSYNSDQSQRQDAVVQSFGIGETAVIHVGNAKVGCIVDLTEIKMPPLSQFRYAHFESEQENDYARLEVIGVEKMFTTGHVQMKVVRT